MEEERDLFDVELMIEDEYEVEDPYIHEEY